LRETFTLLYLSVEGLANLYFTLP